MEERHTDGVALGDLMALDEAASPAANAGAARQAAAFHAREVRELAALVEAGAADAQALKAERAHHAELEMVCREVAAAFDRLVEAGRESADFDRALEALRAGYDGSAEIGLLRRIAETQYPMPTRLAEGRANGVALLPETMLGIKHLARGRPLADAMDEAEATVLLRAWLHAAAGIATEPRVFRRGVAEALDWLAHLDAAWAGAGHGRSVVDDVEAAIYLARATLDAEGFAYAGPDDPLSMG